MSIMSKGRAAEVRDNTAAGRDPFSRGQTGVGPSSRDVAGAALQRRGGGRTPVGQGAPHIVGGGGGIMGNQPKWGDVHDMGPMPATQNPQFMGGQGAVPGQMPGQQQMMGQIPPQLMQLLLQLMGRSGGTQAVPNFGMQDQQQQQGGLPGQQLGGF